MQGMWISVQVFILLHRQLKVTSYCAFRQKSNMKLFRKNHKGGGVLPLVLYASINSLTQCLVELIETIC